MKFLFSFFISSAIGLTIASNAKALTDDLPSDVKAFDTKRVNCLHFLGEEPYNAERKAELIKNVKNYCTGTDKKLARLKKKYSKNAAVLAKLNTYDVDIQ
jgi:hypothetical protein